MFPRFLFDQRDELPRTEHGAVMDDHSQDTVEDDGKKGLEPSQSSSAVSERAGEVLPGYERRTMLQRLKLWNYQPEDETTYWEYFRRPFFLFAFPNVVLESSLATFCEIAKADSHLRPASSSHSAARQALSPSTQVLPRSPQPRIPH